MKINPGLVKDLCSCSACNKETLSTDGMGLDYPYDKVVEITLNSMVFKLCKECLIELQGYIPTILKIINEVE